jgi:rod shape-determining protein MreD
MVTPTPLQRLDHSARTLLPVMSALVLGVVAIIPIGLPAWGALAPPFMLTAVFYWSLTRPDLMAPSTAFVLGLIQDLLSGAPLGSGALIMVLTQWILRSQQRYLAKRPFLLMWIAFAPVVFAASLLGWAIYSLYVFHPAPILGMLVRATLGLVLFPIVAWVVLIPTHRALGTA